MYKLAISKLDKLASAGPAVLSWKLVAVRCFEEIARLHGPQQLVVHVATNRTLVPGWAEAHRRSG
jgi:hypothetical protein